MRHGGSAVDQRMFCMKPAAGIPLSMQGIQQVWMIESYGQNTPVSILQTERERELELNSCRTNPSYETTHVLCRILPMRIKSSVRNSLHGRYLAFLKAFLALSQF